MEDLFRRNFEPIILSTPAERTAWRGDVRRVVRERFAPYSSRSA
jgi:hypothetical protein